MTKCQTLKLSQLQEATTTCWTKNLTNYQLILEQIFYVFCRKKIFSKKVALNRGKKKLFSFEFDYEF